MAAYHRPPEEERMDQLLGILLQVGVLIAALVVAIGGVLYVRSHGGLAPNYSQFKGEPDALRSVMGIITGATGISGRAVIQLGLLILVGTPVARVVFSLVSFARQRDWTYVVVTCIVLLLLTLSLTGILAHG